MRKPLQGVQIIEAKDTTTVVNKQTTISPNYNF